MTTMTTPEALEILKKELACRTVDDKVCNKYRTCLDCPFRIKAGDLAEALKIAIKELE